LADEIFTTMIPQPQGNGFMHSVLDILKEHTRLLLGVLIIVLGLLLAFRQSQAVLIDLVLNAVVVAGLLLAIHGGGSGDAKSQGAAMTQAQAEVIAELKSATSAIPSAINRALEIERELGRLRKDALEVQKVLKERTSERDQERALRTEDAVTLAKLEEHLRKSATDVEALRAQLATLQAEIGAMQAAGDAKLARLLPEGVLDSSIGDLVRWSAAVASDRGDPIAAMILASLQSMAAVKRCNLPEGDVAGHLRALGTSLERLATSQNWDAKRSSETFAQWSVVLNNLAWNDYILFVPALGTPVDLEKMSGRTSGNVTRVLCWGILQKRSNKLVRPAEVA
jgi:hypothetical protein